MASNTHFASERKRRCIALILALTLPMAASVAYLWGCYMDCEYIHWPTIWQASRAKTPLGLPVAELISARVRTSSAGPHWHHCGWCETVYSCAKHFAIKVTVSPSEAYLFDWDAKTGRLMPLTVRTAELLPEVIPSGFIVEPSSAGGFDGQLHNDRPCRIVARRQGS